MPINVVSEATITASDRRHQPVQTLELLTYPLEPVVLALEPLVDPLESLVDRAAPPPSQRVPDGRIVVTVHQFLRTIRVSRYG